MQAKRILNIGTQGKELCNFTCRSKAEVLLLFDFYIISVVAGLNAFSGTLWFGIYIFILALFCLLAS